MKSIGDGQWALLAVGVIVGVWVGVFLGKSWIPPESDAETEPDSTNVGITPVSSEQSRMSQFLNPDS